MFQAVKACWFFIVGNSWISIQNPVRIEQWLY